MTRDPKVVLVGEANPYGVDPRYALYDEPSNSAGGRLRRTSYFRYTDRVNLCPQQWNSREAKARALALAEEYKHQDALIVLLGRKVANTFCASEPPFTLSAGMLFLPHPSGLCREWDVPGSFERARALLREACPEVPWGELEGGRDD